MPSVAPRLGWRKYQMQSEWMQGVLMLVISLLLAVPAAEAIGRLSSAQYLVKRCAEHQAMYKPLIDGYLSQYTDGFATTQLLEVPLLYDGTKLQRDFKGMPLLFVIQEELRMDKSLPPPGKKRLKNVEYFGIPLLQQVHLPKAQLRIFCCCSELRHSKN